jgi:type II secretory pathway pseudopilin PulG
MITLARRLRSSSATRASRAGFTIVELLVAVGITLLLVTLMLTIVTQILSGWNRSTGSLTSGNQARLILEQASQDLQSAVMRRDSTNVWLAATLQPTQSGAGLTGMKDADWSGIVKPSGSESTITDKVRLDRGAAITDYRFGQAGVWLRFFSIPPGANTPLTAGNTTAVKLETISAPRAVAYQMVRRKLGASTGYQLFRSEARPAPMSTPQAANTGNSTFTSGYNLFMPTNPAPSYNVGDSINAPDDQVDGNVGTIRSPRPSQLIGNNVIDFGVRLFVRVTINNGASSELREAFPVNRTGSSSVIVRGFTAIVVADGSPGPTTPDGVSPVVAGYPEAAEILVRILTDEGARLIAAFEAGNTKRPADVKTDAEFWWRLAEANSQVYSRRVDIRGQNPIP